ncbi:MAG: hypothetical protein ACKODA_05550 [Nevskiaceae bacterium]
MNRMLGRCSAFGIRRGYVWMGLSLVLACAPATQAGLEAPLPAGGAACFGVAALSPADQRVAEQILLEFGDREGLYTLAGGLKPISSDVRDLQLRIAPALDTNTLATLEQQRRVAASLTCGDIGVMVQVFTATQRTRDSSEVRNTSMVVFHRGALRAMITRQQAFFATLGVTPSTSPAEILAAVENAPRAPRWRGYGYLFGYPDVAVDFFVQAGEEGDRTGKLVPRDFRRIETVYKFASGTGDSLSTFVYAVPKGAAPTAEESQLRERAAAILTEYRGRRGRNVDASGAGSLALWRAWLTGATAPRSR